MSTFHDPREFLAHLESALADPGLSQVTQTTLLHGCLHTIRYLLESQNTLTERMIKTIDVLNTPHNTWGHKLSELYSALEAGSVSVDEMNQILIKEVCGEKTRK